MLRVDDRCAVDLLMYFYRHSHALLTLDGLALHAGYERAAIEPCVSGGRGVVRHCAN
jgi:hypothetical protein